MILRLVLLMLMRNILPHLDNNRGRLGWLRTSLLLHGRLLHLMSRWNTKIARRCRLRHVGRGRLTRAPTCQRSLRWLGNCRVMTTMLLLFTFLVWLLTWKVRLLFIVITWWMRSKCLSVRTQMTCGACRRLLCRITVLFMRQDLILLRWRGFWQWLRRQGVLARRFRRTLSLTQRSLSCIRHQALLFRWRILRRTLSRALECEVRMLLVPLIQFHGLATLTMGTVMRRKEKALVLLRSYRLARLISHRLWKLARILGVSRSLPLEGVFRRTRIRRSLTMFRELWRIKDMGRVRWYWLLWLMVFVVTFLVAVAHRHGFLIQRLVIRMVMHPSWGRKVRLLLGERMRRLVIGRIWYWWLTLQRRAGRILGTRDTRAMGPPTRRGALRVRRLEVMGRNIAWRAQRKFRQSTFSVLISRLRITIRACIWLFRRLSIKNGRGSTRFIRTRILWVTKVGKRLLALLSVRLIVLVREVIRSARLWIAGRWLFLLLLLSSLLSKMVRQIVLRRLLGVRQRKFMLFALFSLTFLRGRICRISGIRRCRRDVVRLFILRIFEKVFQVWSSTIIWNTTCLRPSCQTITVSRLGTRHSSRVVCALLRLRRNDPLVRFGY